MFIGTVVAALLLGFLAGLLAFRIKSRWCPNCGATAVALQGRHGQQPAPAHQPRTVGVQTHQPLPR
jgi:hypothetical protein